MADQIHITQTYIALIEGAFVHLAEELAKRDRAAALATLLQVRMGALTEVAKLSDRLTANVPGIPAEIIAKHINALAERATDAIRKLPH